MPPIAGALRLWQVQQQQRVGAHERRSHGDLGTVGQAEVLVQLEFLDAAEDVVPAAGVQAGAVLAQFVQDFVHLEGGEDGFDQHGGLDGALRQAQFILGHHEDVVPQARFQVRFHLRQVEVWAGAASQLLFRVVDHEQGEVEDAAGDALAVNGDVFFIQVPAAWTHHQGSGLFVQLVGFAVLFQRDGLADRVLHIDLAGDLVVPVRGVGVFEVGHVGIRAGIQRVDDHLAVDRAGDLHAAAFQGLWNRSDLPVAVADMGGFGQEVRALAGIQALGALNALGQQLLAARFEFAAQLGDQGQCFRGQHALETWLDFSCNLHTCWQSDAHSLSP